jgi:hypothetical protein
MRKTSLGIRRYENGAAASMETKRYRIWRPAVDVRLPFNASSGDLV